jgi:hypothetical protein
LNPVSSARLRPSAIFAHVRSGAVVFEFANTGETNRLVEGDPLMADGSTALTWRNDRLNEARRLWVEMIMPPDSEDRPTLLQSEGHDSRDKSE